MDVMTALVTLLASSASVVGAFILCGAIVRRNKVEARRELFGLRPGQDSWP